MLSFGATTKQTAEDQHLYLEARLVEVTCLDCLARVRVKKNSEHHTSVQWNSEALGQCHEFARMSGEPGGRRVHASCSQLRTSIDRAVAEGSLGVGAEDGY